MADQIELANFNFNTTEIVKSAQVLKKAIEELAKEQAELKKNGAQNSAVFIENTVALKGLKKEYNSHLKVLEATNKQIVDKLTREEKLEAVLSTQGSTIAELRAHNKQLNDLRNNTNLKENEEDLTKLNDALDRNNKLIKENVDQYTQQKINVGNYSESIKEAFADMNLLDGGFINIIQKSKEAGGAGKLAKQGFLDMSTGIKAMTKSAIAFILTPIGAVLTILVVGFLAIKNAMNRSEEATNKITRALAPLGALLDAVLGALEPLGDYFIEGFVVYLEMVEKAVYSLVDAFASLLEFIGADEMANSMREFGDAMAQASEDAKLMADAQAQLTKDMRESDVIQKEMLASAEKFQGIRDDETNTIKDRILANKNMVTALRAQLEEEANITREQIKRVQEQILLKGETTELLQEQADLNSKLFELGTQSQGVINEGIKEENALRNEGAQKAREIVDAKISAMNEEIELFITKQGIHAQTLQEELDLEKEVSRQKLEVLKAELANKNISQAKYEDEVLQLKQSQAVKEAQILVNNAKAEIDLLRAENAKKLEENVFLSDAVAEQRKADNVAELEADAQLAQLKLDSGLITQLEFDTAIRELKEETRLANKEIDDEREAVEKEEAIELRALEFEEELERLEDENASKMEIEQAKLDEQNRITVASLDDQLAKGIISEELYQAKIDAINKVAADNDLKWSELTAEAKLGIASSALSQLATLVDKQSAAGKAIAIAQTGINTAKGMISAIANTPGPAWIGIAMAAIVGAMGLVQTKKIISTKVPSASGSGTVSGGGGGASSVSIPQPPSVNLDNLIPSGASDNASVQNGVEQGASAQNYNQGIQDAVRDGSREGTEQGSNEGITNLSENRVIQEQSSF